ncbi:host attachment protein [Nitratifractor sp.]
MKKDLVGALIVTGDLGEVRVYRVKEELAIDPKDNAQVSHKHNKGTLIDALRPELVTAVEFVEAHKKISEEVTDKEGNYKGHFGSASGEPHNLKLEIEHRLIKEIAETIMRIVRQEDPKVWHLAFPAEHKKALMDRIDPDVSGKLGTVIDEDLVKLKPEKLLERFGA